MNLEPFIYEPRCPTCGEKLIFDAKPAQFLGCIRCNLVTEFQENREFSDFKLIKKREFLKIFAKNSIIIAKLDNQKERRMLGFIWLLMFVILLIVSYIMF